MVRAIGLGCLGLLTIAAFVAASSNSVEQVKKKREVVQIADPVRDFYERYGDAGTNGIRDFKGVKKLLQIQFDVDSDGDDDAIEYNDGCRSSRYHMGVLS